MNIELNLLLDAGGRMRLRSRGGDIPVVSVREACRRLGRSRRQIYRLLRRGALPLRAKILGECLLDAGAVERLASRPSFPQRLPAALAPLLPEYELRALNAGSDADLVLGRVLENGGERQAAWALRRYGRPACAAFLKRRGSALSARSRAFWEAFLGVPAAAAPSWRKAPWPA